MFDNDHDYSKVGDAEVRFTFIERDESGMPITTVERVLRKGEDGFFTLTELLEAFSFFLNGMTFTYVGGVSAFNEAGKDIANSGTL